ncbi:MAG: hypothetical protein ABL996_08385 [Micropepsaceae bacterium]
MALDVAGYSARTEADEARTTAEVAALRSVIEAIAARHAGRVFNTAGDGFMLEFGSSLGAVEAAFELAATCEPKVRVGVHLGDVVVQPNGDLLGHGVNVAARLMAQASPGSALVSADVRRTIRGPLAERLVSRGSLKLDKMAETIEAFALAAVVSAMAIVAQPKSAEHVLAVLPFDNLSNDPDMQFFSDGVSEEILHTIARAKGLRVIGKGSSFQFRGSDKTARRVLGELHATHMLDGSVRRAGDQLRISAQLVETSSQTTLWSERYDRALTDIFALQDEIAGAIARALETALPATSRRPVDPRAYDLYLKARVVARDLGNEALRRAATLLEQTVAIAPEFAEAWAELGAARAFLLPRTRDVIGEPAHDAALAAANRALALDKSCAGGYRTLAMLKPAFSDHAEKLRLIEQALAFAPNDPVIASAAGGAVLSVGRYDEAAAHFVRAAALEPMAPFLTAHVAYFRAGKGFVKEAEASFEDLDQRFPNSPWIMSLHSMLRLYTGQFDKAAQLLGRAGAYTDAVIQRRRETYALHLSILRAPEAARAAMVSDMFDPETSAVLSLTDCAAAAYAGYADLAYARLFEAFATGRHVAQAPDDYGGGAVRAYLLGGTFFINGRAFRADPRFARFCQHAGLVDYWRVSGRWPDCADEVPYDFKAECEKAVGGDGRPSLA